LIDALANKIWAISPDAAELNVYEGGYQVYMEARRQWLEQQRLSQRSKRAKSMGTKKPKKPISKHELARLEELIAD
jgi:ATPase subunit of ABC transporter with duplicated ATPase domains